MTLQILATRWHGVIDYIVGALLIAAPWIGLFAAGGAETWVPVILGAGVIVYSLLTRYEMGLVGLIPMPAHLGLDVLGGLVLAASPWIFGFAGAVWTFHLFVGLAEVGVALVTKTAPVHGPTSAPRVPY